MKAAALALLLATTAPVQAITVSWDFTATPNPVEAGSLVTFRLTPTLGLPDPGYYAPGLDGGFYITSFDSFGHQTYLTAYGVGEWSFFYPDPGSFLASYTVGGYITQAQFCAPWACPLRHTSYSYGGSTAVVVVPGPIVGAGLPGLLLAGASLFTFLRRKRN